MVPGECTKFCFSEPRSAWASHGPVVNAREVTRLGLTQGSSTHRPRTNQNQAFNVRRGKRVRARGGGGGGGGGV